MKTDNEITVAEAQLRSAKLVLEHRLKRLKNKRSKLSLHYNRLRHTQILLSLVEEVLGVIQQDPDHWDDEPDLVPF